MIICTTVTAEADLIITADWEIFCASIASTSTKDEFTSVVATWLDQTPTNFAFTDLYDTITGE